MPETKSIIATSITPTRENLILKLADRSVAIPWERCSPTLAKASATERMEAKLSPGGYGIHWPLLDEDLSVHGLLENWEKLSKQSEAPI